MARKERSTLIPAFDPAELARELETEGDRPTRPPPFDPAAYARIVDEHMNVAIDPQDAARTLTAVSIASGAGEGGDESLPVLGRAMYGCYLQSDFPGALVLAERLLEQEPDHALAKLVV